MRIPGILASPAFHRSSPRVSAFSLEGSPGHEQWPLARGRGTGVRRAVVLSQMLHVDRWAHRHADVAVTPPGVLSVLCRKLWFGGVIQPSRHLPPHTYYKEAPGRVCLSVWLSPLGPPDCAPSPVGGAPVFSSFLWGIASFSLKSCLLPHRPRAGHFPPWPSVCPPAESPQGASLLPPGITCHFLREATPSCGEVVGHPELLPRMPRVRWSRPVPSTTS